MQMNRLTNENGTSLRFQTHVRRSQSLRVHWNLWLSDKYWLRSAHYTGSPDSVIRAAPRLAWQLMWLLKAWPRSCRWRGASQQDRAKLNHMLLRNLTLRKTDQCQNQFNANTCWGHDLYMEHLMQHTIAYNSLHIQLRHGTYCKCVRMRTQSLLKPSERHMRRHRHCRDIALQHRKRFTAILMFYWASR